jgi:hypothetical protein
MTRADLDLLRGTCDLPGCEKDHHAADFIGLRPVCHPNASAFAIYRFERGTVVLMCAFCKNAYVELQIAGALPS